MPRDLVVELVKQRANGSVHIPEAEELPIAQPRQNPALDQQDRPFDLCLVLWFMRPRGHNGCVVMGGEIRIGSVDHRVVKARFGDPGFQVVGHDLRRHTPRKPKARTWLEIQSGSDCVQVASAKV